jgi:hypothetical protein
MAEISDWRHLTKGWEIPSEGYCDQPYLVKTDDGAWLCIMTTGSGHEGQAGQHIVSTRSLDQGRTWAPLVDVEPRDGVEASYAVVLKVASGRIYAFYNHNTDNVREVKADNPPYEDGYCRRVDSLGHFVFKYSDDHGQSWSEDRYDVDVREMAIDRENADGGQLRYFWNVGKAISTANAAYVSLHKVGGFGAGFFTRSEGVLLKSTNILTEDDPTKIMWETLPDGDAGLRTPPGGGPVAEEQSYSILSDGSFYCVYRTIDGHPAFAYSRDDGHSWTTPKYKAFANGRLMKHPRAANFAWRCDNGHFLYWFHNHGGRFVLNHPNRRSMAYQDRNPVWLCGGVEVDSPKGKVIKWSEPEIVMYDDDPYVRMSYPDLIEEDGKYYLSETQKEVARVHEVDTSLLEGLWGQFENKTIAKEGCVLDLGKNVVTEVAMPTLPDFSKRSAEPPYGLEDLRPGFALDVWFELAYLDGGQVLLDARLDNGQGICLITTDRGTVEVVLNDGRTECRWDCDPDVIEEGKLHHLVAIVDGGPKVITFVVDGVLCDGGSHRQFGWGRFSPHLYHVNGSKTLRVGLDVKALRIYDRYLRTSEAIGNFQAGI